MKMSLENDTVWLEIITKWATHSNQAASIQTKFPGHVNNFSMMGDL